MLNLICCVIVTISQAVETHHHQEVDALWVRWENGDAAAMDSLISMGPLARKLGHQLLHSGHNEEPSFPTGRNLELLSALLADAMPELATALPEFDEADREECLIFLEGIGGDVLQCDHGRCRSGQGRFARPLADVLVNMYDSADGWHQELILRILAKAGAGSELRVAELNRGISECYFGDTSTVEADEDFGRLRGLLEIFGLGPEPAVANRIRSIAVFHPNVSIRNRALVLYLSSQNDPVFAASYLDDIESEETGLGEVSPRRYAMETLLTCKTLPKSISNQLLKILYRASFEDVSLDISDLCEVICRCESFDVDSMRFVDCKIRELLSDNTMIEESLRPSLVRACAAAVVLRCYPEDEIAAAYLLRILSSEQIEPLYGPKGSQFRDPRAEAARAFRRVPALAQRLLNLKLVNDLLESELSERPGSDFCIECALLLATLDSKNALCIEAIRGTDESTLVRLSDSWAEVQRILGDRASKLIDSEKVTKQVRSNEFVTDSSNPWAWERLQPVASDIIPLLKNHLDSPNTEIRLGAIRALRHLKANSDITAQLLMQCMNDESIEIKIAAIDALADLPASADLSAPQLQLMLDSDYLSISISAEMAISQIRRLRDAEKESSQPCSAH
ncbi:MAG: hypothetical protein JNL58_29105 [Planctomyces sp.]|nr:hypothetical protein [Planctomyces sp.]